MRNRLPSTQAEPSSQLLQIGPPQSRSVSRKLKRPSLQASRSKACPEVELPGRDSLLELASELLPEVLMVGVLEASAAVPSVDSGMQRLAMQTSCASQR